MAVEQLEAGYGLGCLEGPTDDRDFPIEDAYALDAIDVDGLAIPATYVVPHRAPVLNQNGTPMCVAYSTSGLKSYQDRDDQVPAKFWNFDEPAFFRAIGGSANGAVLRYALDRLLKVGYPVVGGVSPTSRHRIRGYYAVPKTLTGIKTAILTYGELVLSSPWYHSWMHTTSAGVLPRPDYLIGGHAIIVDGWNATGIRLRNSWGTNWGLDGDCYMPNYYALHAVREYWKALD